MAKSLRSKPKLRAKSVKRKGEFTKFVDDRNARLAEKTRLNLQKQNEAKMAEDMPMEEASENATAAPPSTSRKSVSARKKMKVKKSRNKKLKF